jgi:hypothetical protein
MIQLHPDYLIFQTALGEAIPCSAETVTVELMGEAAASLDPDVIRQAASAVLHYFKHDLERTFVSVDEFAQALEKVLTKLGFDVLRERDDSEAEATADLSLLASRSGKGFEQAFFPRLRDELRKCLGESPQTLRFHGLRGCVKQLTGAKRWNNRCQRLSDQIVSYVRQCLQEESERHSSCDVVIR